MLSLLLSSEEHRDALLKMLNESHVPEGTTMKDLEYIVGQIAGMNTITYSEDELIPEGTDHVKSLYITIECKGMIISWVLIDNSSTLNVCPMLTLSRIGIDDSLVRPNGIMVRAFDGTKTSAYGEIDLKVLVGPCEFGVSLVVMDVPTIFNVLLGHP